MRAPIFGVIVSGSGNSSPNRVLKRWARSLRELEMLGLVFTNRDRVRLVDQDVGRLQDRIGEDPEVLPGPIGFLLELGHSLQLPEAGQSAEDPGQLDVLGNLGLVVEKGTLRVDTYRQQHPGRLVPSRPQVSRLIGDGHRVEVDNAVDRLVVLLEGDPVPQGPHEAPHVEVAGGLNA